MTVELVDLLGMAGLAHLMEELELGVLGVHVFAVVLVLPGLDDFNSLDTQALHFHVLVYS